MIKAAGVRRVIHVIDSLGQGGAQAVVFELASRLPSNCVFSLRGRSVMSVFNWEPVVCRDPNVIDSSWRTLNIIRLIRMCAVERRRALFVAHLDASTLLLCLMKRLFRFRLFVMVHASPQQWPRWYRRLFRTFIGAADLVVAGGEQHRQRLLDEGSPPDKTILIGIASRLFDDGTNPPDRDVRTELGIPREIPILLNVARMVPGKGQAELIRALSRSQNPRAVAIIVGDGPEKDRLKALSHDLRVSNRVFFPGLRTDLQNFYSVATAFVMPCLDESMGVVILEALAYRLPIVAYDSGCITDFLRHGETGFLIRRDSVTLAATLDSVLASPFRPRVEETERFSMRAMADRFRALCIRHGGLLPA